MTPQRPGLQDAPGRRGERARAGISTVTRIQPLSVPAQAGEPRPSSRSTGYPRAPSGSASSGGSAPGWRMAASIRASIATISARSRPSMAQGRRMATWATGTLE